jgi:excisionase family DNA binding protein
MNPERQKTELLTVSEASEVLRVKQSTLRSWVLKRRLPFIKMGSRVLFRLADLQALIEAGLRPAIPAVQGQGGVA